MNLSPKIKCVVTAFVGLLKASLCRHQLDSAQGFGIYKSSLVPYGQR